MRTPLLAAALVVLVGAAGASRSVATVTEPMRVSKGPAPVLGISYRAPGGTLAWFRPLTLRKLPGRRAPLAGHLGSWAFSADRSVLAIGSCGTDGFDERAGIRFVNARTMRVLGDVRLSTYASCASSVAWLRPDRLLVVVRTAWAQEAEVVVLDPIVRRVVRRTALPWAPWSTAQTHDELVLLLATTGAIDAARVAVVDPEGSLRTSAVGRVRAGSVVLETGADYRQRIVSPGLAVDPGARRVFLVPAAGPVAELDLRALDVSYHELDEPSLVQRLLGWLTPSAQAKLLEGTMRQARWLGDGVIAVSGMDSSTALDGQGERVPVGSPAGLSLIDTRSWRTRTLDVDASEFAAAPGLVVVQGGRWNFRRERGTGLGLVAFGIDGRERWRIDPGEYRWIEPVSSLGYVWVADGRRAVVDLATGSVLRSLRRDEQVDPWPQLLAAQSAGW
jgi:hypothetical protein